MNGTDSQDTAGAVPTPQGDAPPRRGPTPVAADEARAVALRYARRGAVAGGAGMPGRYSLLRPDVWQTVQERQRAMLQLFVALGLNALDEIHLVEVGCGAGGNLLELLRLGFRPRHLTGIELLPERFAQARSVLPAALRLVEGDACVVAIEPESMDIVMQATVFSSLLDDAFQQQLASTMWRWVKPGGGVLWYDFTVDNPRNPDVRGVPPARVRELFPGAVILSRRVTLAPPLARAACALHPALYRVLNVLPPLRTHQLAWIGKKP